MLRNPALAQVQAKTHSVTKIHRNEIGGNHGRT